MNGELSVGAPLVYCDVTDDGLIDPAALIPLVTDRTRAVIATHLYGQMCDVDKICRVVTAGVRVIEDCAQSHGERMRGRMAGAVGDISTFSFYPTKNLAAIGDGGAIATQDAALERSARALRMSGWASKYEVAVSCGRNSRQEDLQAALLTDRLASLDERNGRHRAIAAELRAAAPSPILGADDEPYVGHLCVMAVDDRERVRAALTAQGVQTDVHYPTPDYRQSAWLDGSTHLPVTERLCATVGTLPCFPEITDAEVEVEIVKRSLGGLR